MYDKVWIQCGALRRGAELGLRRARKAGRPKRNFSLPASLGDQALLRHMYFHGHMAELVVKTLALGCVL